MKMNNESFNKWVLNFETKIKKPIPVFVKIATKLDPKNVGKLPNILQINFYNSDSYKAFPYSKPISKIISLKNIDYDKYD